LEPAGVDWTKASLHCSRATCLAWVAQATRLFRRATRPTERSAVSKGTMQYSRTQATRPRLPASRREGRAGRPYHPHGYLASLTKRCRVQCALTGLEGRISKLSFRGSTAFR